MQLQTRKPYRSPHLTYLSCLGILGLLATLNSTLNSKAILATAFALRKNGQ